MSTREGVDLEDVYFAQRDQENKQKLAEKLAGERDVAAAAERKALHGGKCGKCGGELAQQVFRGEHIDVCGDCGAVLLDPGELQKLAGEDESSVLHGLAAIFGGRR